MLPKLSVDLLPVIGNDGYLLEDGRVHVRRLKVQVHALPLGGP